MKRISLFFFLLLLVPIGVGCQSNEQKASALVKDYLYGVLNDFKSYEPAAIEVEPLYNTPVLDKDYMDIARLMSAADELVNEYDTKAMEAQSKMNLYMFDTSASGQMEYDFAARRYYENKISSLNSSIRYWEYAKEVKEQAAKMDENEQIGWIITHSFRSNNELGLPVLSSYTFTADKDFQSILAAYDNGDARNKNAVLTLRTIINDEESLESYDELIDGMKETIATYQDLKSKLKY